MAYVCCSPAGAASQAGALCVVRTATYMCYAVKGLANGAALCDHGCLQARHLLLAWYPLVPCCELCHATATLCMAAFTVHCHSGCLVWGLQHHSYSACFPPTITSKMPDGVRSGVEGVRRGTAVHPPNPLHMRPRCLRKVTSLATR